MSINKHNGMVTKHTHIHKLNATATKTKYNSTAKPHTQTMYELHPAVVLCHTCIPEKGDVNKK